MWQDPGVPLTTVIALDHGFISGGQSRVAIDSALGLKRHGQHPIVFAASGPVDPVLQEHGIEVVCLDQPDLIHNPSKLAAARQGIWNTSAAEALGDLLSTLPRGRTVVHVHGWAKALSPSIAGPIATSGLPAVYTMHEFFMLCPNGGFYNYRTQHPCHLTPLSGACWATDCDSRSYTRKLWRNMRQTVLKYGAKLPEVFDDYILISEFQKSIIGDTLPAKARLHLVSNPISAVDLGPKPDAARGDFIFVGRLSPEKGPLLFAEAARRQGIRPVFVGDGPMRAELIARYPEAEIRGWQGQAAVAEAMRSARALVFPSLWYEGQPLTVLEAKALGTPVIVSDGCAGRDSIEDGVNGVWFRCADADDLGTAMARLAHDGTAVRMSAAAYQSFWSDPPTIDRHVRDIMRIYRAATGTRDAVGSLADTRAA
ncbi:glycosyltransferase family 4 protein [Lichenifustis flavocetrariae]|uniref:Glycosyltransferase family 4 protein n=1 Tax=Lichenifustis flavocetrariae TaxID=2949735 RepID=A0AA42CKQ4_9HYPH|nr:glycosyltransferase family 4 protein [Lichenifustis flavocetrariae]MCW6510803.1 glycosyltransferase family 4 protein [Lichenifustis flavocetrariae]